MLPAVESGLVTTIIPVFNRARMLREAVDSVLAQTYRPIEILVVDDGSTDDTADAADALAAAHPAEIRVIHQANRGVAMAREAARLVARGEFIQHLDSDDVLYPRKFELQVAGLREHPECGVSYGWTRGIKPDGSINKGPERGTGTQHETMFPKMLETRFWHTPTPLYRASLVHENGPWLDLCHEEDWEYDARMAVNGVRLHYVADWISESRHHHEGRLSGQGLDAKVLRDRARAHALILQHGRRAGIGTETPEMQVYARELFLLSRQCGAVGLESESEMLFNLARDASGPRRDARQFRLYAAAARLLGWSRTGWLACMSDRLR
jgi:glycosyltransferase involved in cell wall biosynthesis